MVFSGINTLFALPTGTILASSYRKKFGVISWLKDALFGFCALWAGLNKQLILSYTDRVYVIRWIWCYQHLHLTSNFLSLNPAYSPLSYFDQSLIITWAQRLWIDGNWTLYCGTIPKIDLHFISRWLGLVLWHPPYKLCNIRLCYLTFHYLSLAYYLFDLESHPKPCESKTNWVWSTLHQFRLCN